MTTEWLAQRRKLAEVRQELYVDGRAVPGAGETMTVISPGSEEVAAEFPGASQDQVHAAIGAARRAFDSGVWSGRSPQERAAGVLRLMDYLASQREQLVALAVWEAGCPVNSPVMPAQVDAGLKHGRDAIDLYLQLPDFEDNPLPFGERFTAASPVMSLRRYLPIGVVAGISAYNYPFYTNMWKVIPALLTGNCVVLRPSPLTPLAALVFGQAAEAAGLPPGVLNVVAETGTEGAVILTSHRSVDMVAFTGSSVVGTRIAAQAAPTMKRLQLELGGKSARIYLPDSLDQAHTAAAQTCLAHAGQGCSLGTRIFVPEAEKPRLVEAMAAALGAARLGDPSDPATEIGPVISAAQRARCQHFVDLAVAAGARVALGGKPPASFARGFYFEPTILDMPDNSNPAAQEEIFGPVVAVIGYRDIDHVVQMANDSPYGLAAYVHGADVQRAVAVASRLQAGSVNVNGGAHTAFASSGGWRMSGLGRERGVEGLRIYQQIQTFAARAY